MIVVIGKVYTCKHKIFEKRTNICNIIFSQSGQSLVIVTLRSKVFIWSCQTQNEMKDKYITLIEQFQNPNKINRKRGKIDTLAQKYTTVNFPGLERAFQ